MNPAIFVWSYPNNEKKIEILKKTLLPLRKTGLPIISISNYKIKDEILELFDDHYTGENSDCCFEEYFSDSDIDLARLNSKYLCHYYPNDSQVIHYKQFSYARGCTYHYSALSQWGYTMNFFIDKKYTHGFIIEGDNILEDSDIPKIQKYFNELENEKINFILALPLMMDFMVATSWFFKYSPELNFEISCEKFLKTTYPDFACERFLYQNILDTNLPGKIIINEDDNKISYGPPNGWSFEKIKNTTPNIKIDGLNLLFPNSKYHSLSSSEEKNYQSPLDPLNYGETGIGKEEDQLVFFCWNKYNGNTVRSVYVDAKICNNENIFWQSSSESFPGNWYFLFLPELHPDYYCEIKFIVIDIENKKYEKNYKFTHII